MNRTSRLLKGEDYFSPALSLHMVRAEEYFDFPFHSHDFIEFAFVSEGQGFHHIEDRVASVSAGEMIVIPVGTSHVFRPKTAAVRDRLVVYNCLFSPALLRSLRALIAEDELVRFVDALIDGRTPSLNLIDSAGAIGRSFADLYREYAAVNRSGTLLNGLLLQLLARIHREIHAGPQSGNKHPEEGFDFAIAFLEKNYGEEITLGRMAGQLPWSERQLQRLFHKHTGQSFRSFLQELRIRKSCELLRDSRQKVAAIANAVGYKDANAFAAVFRRATGKTPGAFRAAARLLEGGEGSVRIP